MAPRLLSPGSASLRLGLLMVPRLRRCVSPLRGLSSFALGYPRFRFAPLGATHGAAPPALGVAAPRLIALLFRG